MSSKFMEWLRNLESQNVLPSIQYDVTNSMMHIHMFISELVVDYRVKLGTKKTLIAILSALFGEAAELKNLYNF